MPRCARLCSVGAQARLSRPVHVDGRVNLWMMVGRTMATAAVQVPARAHAQSPQSLTNDDKKPSTRGACNSGVDMNLSLPSDPVQQNGGFG